MKLPKFFGRPSKRKLFVVRRVVGESMAPTLAPGAVIFGVWPLGIRVGDIVIIQHGGLEKTKRVKNFRSGELFVVGDNPAASTDSRDFGWVSADAVVARVVR